MQDQKLENLLNLALDASPEGSGNPRRCRPDTIRNAEPGADCPVYRGFKRCRAVWSKEGRAVKRIWNYNRTGRICRCSQRLKSN